MGYTPAENLRHLASRVAVVLPTGSWARTVALDFAHGDYSAPVISEGLVAVRTDLGKLDPEDRCKGETTALGLLDTLLLPRAQEA